ncbi:MAG: regulatory protein RecX [candidate division NC10 bacterium]
MRHRSPRSAYQAAVALLAVRDRTRFELSRLLAARGFPQAELESALDRLKEQGYLNDRRLATIWAKSRLQAKPMGPYRLRQELDSKGVEEHLVREVLRELYENGEEVAARRAMAAKVSELRHLPAASRTGRVARFLQRRGFSTPVIWRLLGEGRQAHGGHECPG